jgi:solute carrier family 50 protein (sugar transporter)
MVIPTIPTPFGVCVIITTVSSMMMAAASTIFPRFVDLCATLAPPMSVVLCAAPLPTILDIQKAQDVGEYPLLPYSCMTSNCALWTTYGVLKQSSTVWVPNLVGLLLGLYYMKSFIRFAPKSAPTLPGSVGHHLIAVMCVLCWIGVSTAFLSIPASVVGTVATIFCVAMFASPLAAMKTVIRDRSAQSIPLPFTVASLMNCFFWSVIGFFQFRDRNIIIPNVLGLTFSLVQVALIFYGNTPRETDSIISP